MSKSYRKEVLKRLQQELNETTDTKEIIRIGNTIAKLTKPKQRRGRPSNKKPVEATPSHTKLSIIGRITGSAVDNLSDGEKVLNWLVVEVEKMQKEQHRKFTTEEQRTVFGKLIEGLSARDRAAFESQNVEVA